MEGDECETGVGELTPTRDSVYTLPKLFVYWG